jgi:hypothetical protein
MYIVGQLRSQNRYVQALTDIYEKLLRTANEQICVAAQCHGIWSLQPISRNSTVASRQVSAVLALYCSSRAVSSESLHHLTTLLASNKNRASLVSWKYCYLLHAISSISTVDSRLQRINYRRLDPQCGCSPGSLQRKWTHGPDQRCCSGLVV